MLAFILAVIVYRTVGTIMMAQSAELSRGVLGVDATLLASITSSVVLLVIISLMEMVCTMHMDAPCFSMCTTSWCDLCSIGADT